MKAWSLNETAKPSSHPLTSKKKKKKSHGDRINWERNQRKIDLGELLYVNKVAASEKGSKLMGLLLGKKKTETREREF